MEILLLISISAKILEKRANNVESDEMVYKGHSYPNLH